MKSIKEIIEMMERASATPELKKEEQSLKDIIKILASLEKRMSDVVDAKARCKCCKDPMSDSDEAFSRIHGMMHKLLPHLNEDKPIVGQQAMMMLLVHKHLDVGLSKGAMLEMVSDHWDQAVRARALDEDDEDEEDE